MQLFVKWTFNTRSNYIKIQNKCPLINSTNLAFNQHAAEGMIDGQTQLHGNAITASNHELGSIDISS